MSVRLTSKEWFEVLADAKALTRPPASAAHYTSVGEQIARREDKLRATVERIIDAHVAPWREIAKDAEERP